MKHSKTALAVAFLALAPLAPAHAQFGGGEATAVREGFTLPAGEVKVLVFRPNVSVGEQTTGGMNQPSVEWTEAAKGHLLAALQKEQSARGTTLVLVPELEGEQNRLVADYTALFRTVAEAAFQHKMFPGNRLPTKKKEFDWTLGAEAERLKALGGDYGLFFFTYDSYGSTGRKVAQILGAVMGFGLMSSGVHVGYAGLVDLSSGDLVWLNADLSMGGDVRTADGAEKRVAQLLEEFPVKGTGTAVAQPARPAVDRSGEATIELPGTGAVDDPKTVPEADDKAKEPQL
ncbi:hypothetical protein A6F68_01429 [Tsuneonella dongtanensis]|uniref:Uncharacterized protein n=1 Tax=Tsuneonella dongtanensis TaxID=692370 RepID=A0A1B2AD14_9SPHN|nr:hypothetical protein [Tsuneonella dongtanensis]ANY19945.1 hypothetical protein A6F68_01429 [Tsuneonella dongtanensis]